MENPNQRQSSDTIFSPKSIITVYTILFILLEMRKQLGLEAMLEYLEKYITLLEKNNPNMKQAVSHASKYLSIHKIYCEAMRNDDS